MPLKAKLSVILKADDVVVAETGDIMMWVQILTTLIQESKQVGASPGGAHQDAGHLQQLQHEVVQNFS